MAWRLAKSLEVLTAEIKAKAPRTTVYNIGDPDHQARSSDHNPNDAGVVCAIDVMPGGGLDLGEVAEDVRQRRHPAGKYVIYQDRIASASRGWEWRDHAGEYHEHVHVSVGVGPDGESTGPYDNTEPWLGDDMNADQSRKLDNVERILTTWSDGRKPFGIKFTPADPGRELPNPFVGLDGKVQALADRPATQPAPVDQAMVDAAVERALTKPEILAAIGKAMVDATRAEYND